MNVFDLGNTRAHGARWNGRLTGGGPIEYADLFRRKLDDPIVYSCVNTPMGARFDRVFRGARRLGRDFPAAIRNRTKQPDRVGADRLANGVAGWARCRRACVVVDVGTAITFNVVNGRGDFVGGMIAPGPGLQARALHEHTALLPEVKVRGARRAIGRFTEEAIESGIAIGLIGLVKEGLARIRRELGTRPRSFATGGGGALVREAVDDVVDWLTLEGIARSADQAE
jgi:type III pantothenate kinase